MSTGNTCRECGALIPADSPGGFCAQCLFGLGLKEVQSAEYGVRSEEGDSSQSNKPSIIRPLMEKSGDRIGRYKLLQEIGHGGCGVVYMAEQEEPVRRKVALKVIKLGMDTRQVVARFEAERQALALMDHSNIAKVLDAGATDTGRPYFVMELVGGIKITDYCDQKQLTIRQRLDLFIQVCRAIQHAHQKGVIHRDLKPSNVLVAEQDGVPVPKVIDFGIAKATQGRLTDETLFTAFEQFLGTPAYMSPEQTQLGSLDVDTRSDIYSLGVLLYELLTGTTPFDTKELVAAGLDEMRRTIREVEPVKPSTRLTQELNGQKVGRVAPRAPSSEEKVTESGAHGVTRPTSRSEIDNRQSAIPTDLDWIVMKCLEKDRACRYETANGLARDIERHLQNEPVVASPPSQVYRFQKAVRRNKTAFTAAAVVVFVLAAGVFASTWQAVRATRAEREQSRLRQQAETAQANEARERKNAEIEAVKSKEVAQFLKDMLKGVGPSKALGRDTTMLKEILDKTAERVGTDLTNQPEAELELRDTLAATYLDLGLPEPAEQMARASLRLSRERFGEKSAEAARALLCLGAAQRVSKKLDQAEVTLREAFNQQKALGASCYPYLPATAGELGLVLWFQGKVEESEAVLREGLRVAKQELGAQSEVVAALLRLLGLPLHSQERWTEGLASQREALAIVRKLFGDEHPELALALNDLGFTLGRQGDFEAAEAKLREALAMRRRLLGSGHEMTADSMFILSWVLMYQGKLEEAERLARESYAVKKKALGHSADHLANLIEVLQAEGKHNEAVALCRDELPNLRAAVSASEETMLAWVLAGFADSFNAQGKFTEAEPLARDAVAIFEKNDHRSWRRFNAQRVLGSSLLGKQRFAEAEPLLLSGYRGMREDERLMLGSRKAYVKQALQQMLQLYETTGRLEQVPEWKQKLEDFDRIQTTNAASASPPKSPP